MTCTEILEVIIHELNKEEFTFLGKIVMITEKTKFFELGFDNLDILEFIENIEVFLNLNLRSIEIDCLNTIQDLVQIIYKKEQNEIKR